MELEEADFDAKASQIQIEVSSVLTQEIIKRGNKHLPEAFVNEIFHRAIKHYLMWAYQEGLGVHVAKLTTGSEDKD